MNKKSVIVLAVLLFLGLGTFVFANPSLSQQENEESAYNLDGDSNKETPSNNNNNKPIESGKTEGNNNVSPEDDNIVNPSNDDKDSSAEQNSNSSSTSNSNLNNNGNNNNNEVNNSGSSNSSDENVRPNYDSIKSQVANLVAQVVNAKNKSDIDRAREYLNSNNLINTIANIKDIDVKNKLDNDINNVIGVLNDNEKPKVEGITNNSYTKDNVSITVTENNLKEIILNNKKVSASEIANITGEGSYTLVVRDKAYNEEIVSFTIDRTSPVLKLEYNIIKLTNQDVVATIKANEALRVDDSSWVLSSDLKSMTKTFKENTSGLVSVTDLAGNKAIMPYEIVNIDKSPIEGEIQLSIIDPTVNNVRVFIFTNKDVLVPDGWHYLNNNTKKILYKDFKDNIELQEVTVMDEAGNEKILNYEVTNIDRVAPMVENRVISNTELTDQNVIYKIIFNEPIKDNVVGWTLENKNTLVREFTNNGSGSIIVEDLAGNTSRVDFEVNNIDKLVLEANITYSEIELTNKDIRAIITANKEVKEIDGWKYLENDKTKLYKDFAANTSEIVAVSDNLGHIALVNCEIGNIDKDAPVLEVNYVVDYLDNNKIMVVVSADEELEITKELTDASWILSSTKMAIFKNAKVGDKGTIEVKDLAGNSAKIDYEVVDVQNKTFASEVFISNSNYTNKDVTVTIKTEKPIKSLDGEIITDDMTEIRGWKISVDRQTLTKIYSEKAYKQYLILKDEEGNVSIPRFEITNVDKNMPEVSDDDIVYNKLSDNRIEVNIKVSKEVYTPNGWSNVENYRKFKKVFAKDEVEVVKLSDLYGNVGYITIDTRNI